MKRRTFFKMLGGLAAGAAVGAERPAYFNGVFNRFLLNFSVARGHRIPDEPVLLHLDGIECF